MRPEQRASIALICGAINNNVRYSSAFDYSRSRYCAFAANSYNSNNISVFDYERGCYVVGNLASLFDYGSGNYVHIERRGNQYQGFDYASSCYFVVTVNGSNISFYDYENSSYLNFVIS